VYINFFNLREQPFNLTPDPRFLFLSPHHEEALSHLLYGIYERRGFIEIAGEVGTGKTILCRSLLERLGETVSTALIFNAYLTEMELLQSILKDFGLTCQEHTRKGYIDTLNQYLLHEFAAGRNAVVIIDEAQNLDYTVLEQLRMLSNLETANGKLLQVVLVGQPELRDKLSTPQMRQLDQRIAVRFHLHSLSRTETRQYILHRMSVAGAANSVTFTPRAWSMIHRYCDGIPRRINLLCDRILMTAYVRDRRRITLSIVRQSWRDLGGAQQSCTPPRSRPHPALARLALGGLVGLGSLSLFSGVLIFPAVQERLRPLIPNQVLALTQLSPSPPPLPQPIMPLLPALMPLPTAQPALSMQADLALAQTLWRVKTQVDHIVLQRQTTQPIDRAALLRQVAGEMGFDVMAIQANPTQLSRLSRPCLIEVGPASQPVFWVLARGLPDRVLIYQEPEGLVSIPLQQLQQTGYGTLYLTLEVGTYRGPTLKQGMRGVRVQALQRVLQDLGYSPGPLAGQFEIQTVQAVKAFQRDNQLVVDGQVGRQTLMMLLYLDDRILAETT
jgi:general secretion pathway protein A